MLEELRSAIGEDLRTAMRARAALDVRALRALLSTLDNSTAVPWVVKPFGGGPSEVPRRELSPEEIAALIADTIATRTAAIAEYMSLGMDAEVSEFRREIEVLSRYLPLPSE